MGAAAAGAIGHVRHGTVCWRLAGAFAAAALPVSFIGTLANRAAAADALLVGFAALLLVVAALTWRRVGGGLEATDRCPDLHPRVVAAGLAIGLLTGLFGVGGGFAIVPALALGLRVPLRRSIATSLVIVAVVSMVGLGEHLAAGAGVAWRVVLPFVAAAALTASFGGTIARRLPQRTLARGFALLLAGIAGYFIISVAVFGGPPNG